MTREDILTWLKTTIEEILYEWDSNDAETIGAIKVAMSVAEVMLDEVSE